jgi:hypothetical protein
MDILLGFPLWNLVCWEGVFRQVKAIEFTAARLGVETRPTFDEVRLKSLE